MRGYLCYKICGKRGSMLEKEELEQLLKSTLATALAPVKSDIKEIKHKLSEHDVRFERIEQRLDRHDEILMEYAKQFKEIREEIKNIWAEIKEIRGEIKELKADNVEIRKELKELKTDNTEIRKELKELKVDNTEIRKELKELKTDNTEIRKEFKELKTDYTVQFKEIRQDLKAIHLQIEQEVLPAIHVIAEGHHVLREDLNKKLDIAIKDRENRERMDLRVTKLEYDVKKIKKQLSLA